MSLPRHFSRHLHATVAENVRSHLESCGWLAPGQTGEPPANFVPLLGAKPVTWQTRRPEESDLKSIEPNLVAISFGGQADDLDEQLGGGLVSQEHPFFVDVYAENDGVALAICEDVRDYLVGRVPGGRFFRLVDQETQTVVLGYRGEYVDVFREPVDRALPSVRWQVVRATANVEMPGES